MIEWLLGFWFGVCIGGLLVLWLLDYIVLRSDKPTKLYCPNCDRIVGAGAVVNTRPDSDDLFHDCCGDAAPNPGIPLEVRG
jgi:hypothetical protein